MKVQDTWEACVRPYAMGECLSSRASFHLTYIYVNILLLFCILSIELVFVPATQLNWLLGILPALKREVVNGCAPCENIQMQIDT